MPAGTRTRAKESLTAGEIPLGQASANGTAVDSTPQRNQRSVPIAEIHIKATSASNHTRVIELKIPTNPNEIFLGF